MQTTYINIYYNAMCIYTYIRMQYIYIECNIYICIYICMYIYIHIVHAPRIFIVQLLFKPTHPTTRGWNTPWSGNIDKNSESSLPIRVSICVRRHWYFYYYVDLFTEVHTCINNIHIYIYTFTYHIIYTYLRTCSFVLE